MADLGFWASPFGGFVINLLASGVFETGRGLKDRWQGNRAEARLLETIASQLFDHVFYVAPEALRQWLDGLSDDLWQSMQGTHAEDKAPAVASIKALWSGPISDDLASEAISIVTTCLLATDAGDFRERLARANIHEKLKEIKADQEHILELVLIELYRLQERFDAPYQRSPKPNRPLRFWVDPLPSSIINRSSKLEEIVALLVEPSDSPVTVTSLRGAGGTGKTILARAACHRPELWQRFPGGIYWAVVGDNPQLPQIAGQLFSQVTGRSIPSTTNALLLVGDELERNPEPALVVLDDIWDGDVFASLAAVMPSNVRVLATTRGVNLGSSVVKVDELTEVESLELLKRGFQLDPETRSLLCNLAKALGHWALLIDLAAKDLDRARSDHDDAAVREAAASIINDFRDDPTVLDDESSRDRSFERMIDRSLQQLGEQTRRQFDHLAAFPPDAEISAELLPLLWDCPAVRARQTVTALERCGLVTISPNHSISLHDLVVALLHRRVGPPGCERLITAHLRCSSPAIGELTTGTARWWYHHLLHAEAWDRLAASFSADAIRRYLELFGSHALFLQACRSVADHLGTKKSPAQTWAVWLAARLAEATVVSSIRSLPVSPLIALAETGRVNEAFAYASEAADLVKATAVPAIHATDLTNSEVLDRALALTDTIDNGSGARAQALAAIATQLDATDATRAAEILDRALALTNTIDNRSGARAQALAAIATHLHATDPTRATEILDRALALTDTIDNTFGARSQALATIATQYHATDPTNPEALDRALALTDTIDNSSGARAQSQALATIATQLHTTDATRATEILDRALALTDTINNTFGARARALATIATQLHTTDPTRATEILDRALALIDTIDNGSGARARSEALATIATQLHATDPTNPEVLDRALALTNTIDNTFGARSEALATIATQLHTTDPTRATEILDRALALTDTINNGSGARARSEALATIATQLHTTDPTNPEVLDRALALTNTIDNTFGARSDALATIATQLHTTDPTRATEILDRALALTNTADNTFGARSEALATIATQLHTIDPTRATEILDRALALTDTITGTITDTLGARARSQALAAVAARFHATDPTNPEVLDRVLALTDAVTNTLGARARSQALATIATQLHATDPTNTEVLDRALALTDTIDNTFGARSKALAAIAARFHATDPTNPEVLDRALAVTDTIDNGSSARARSEALATIATQLHATDPTNPEVLDRALALTDTIDNGSGARTRALATIATQLHTTDPARAAEVLDRAIALTDTINNTLGGRSDALAAIATQLHATDPATLGKLLAHLDGFDERLTIVAATCSADVDRWLAPAAAAAFQRIVSPQGLR